MTKEHKLRLACRGLKGQERRDTMIALCLDPKKIDEAIATRMRYITDEAPIRGGVRRPRPIRPKTDMSIRVQVTYKQYLELKRRAKGTSMSKMVVKCCLSPDTQRQADGTIKLHHAVPVFLE